MVAWKTVRIVCIILLLLPIVHLAVIMSRDTLAVLDPSPNAWLPELEEYASSDADTVLPEAPILVIGGQRVRLWRELEELLAPRPVLMRGLGDAIVEDLTHHYPRLVGHYRPETVVLLPSNSEFYIRDSKSAEDLVTAIDALVDTDAAFNSTRHFYVFTPIKTPLRPQDHATIDRATALLQEWAASDQRVEVLDSNTLLCDPQGTPRASYFLGDGINLNEHGYLRLSLLLLAQLEEQSTGPAGPRAPAT